MNKDVSPFDKDRDDDEKLEILASDHPRSVNLERISVSLFSPGVVGDDEVIARQIHSPHHLAKDGKVNPAAFEDAFLRGLSTNRINVSSEEEIHRAGSEKADIDRERQPEEKKSQRQYVGFVRAKVKDIRSIIEPQGEGLQLFGVYDTGLESSPNHSDVFCILPAPEEKPKAKKKERRRELMKVFESEICKP